MNNSLAKELLSLKKFPRGPLLIAGLYLLTGVLWITCSDLALDWLVDNPQQRILIGMVKGYGYVAATAIALFFAMRHLQRRAVRARDEQLESEQAYRNLFENNPDPMWIVDTRSLKFLAVNRAAMRVYGYTRSEFDEMTLQQLLDVDAGITAEQMLAGAADPNSRRGPSLGKSPREILHHGVLRHRTCDGRLLYVETASYTTHFDGIAASTLIAHDISLRVEIENDLRESKSRLRFAQQLAGFGMVALDIERGELIWSDEALRIYGFDPAQPAPTLDESFARMEEADRHIMHRRFQQALAGKKVPPKTQLRVRLADGSLRYLQVHLGERQWQSDGSTRLVIVLKDITERKLIEQRLKNSERHHRQLVELLPEALLVLVGREVRFANPAAKKLFGSGNGMDSTNRNLIGIDFGELMAGGTKTNGTKVSGTKVNGTAANGAETNGAETDVDAMLRAPGAGFRRHRYRRLNGETFDADSATIVRTERLSWAEPASSAALPTVVLVIRDLTSQRQMQEALTGAHSRLQRMSSQLIRAGEAVRHRIGRELHDDVGQLLTFVNMTASALEKNLAGDEQENRAIALRAAASEALGKVRDLALMLRPPQLDAQGLEAALDAHLERFLQDSGVSFTLRCQGLGARESEQRPDPDIEIALFRVVQEAVTNVVRHASATHVDIRIAMYDGCVELKLVDDGGGFDVERALQGANTAGVLGMRERTLLLGGEFQLQSALGVGTELSVRLPRAVSP